MKSARLSPSRVFPLCGRESQKYIVPARRVLTERFEIKWGYSFVCCRLAGALRSIAQDPVITCMTVSPEANRVLVGGRTVDSFEVRTSRRGVTTGPRRGHGRAG